MRFKRFVHCTVNIACSVVVILFMGKLYHDFEYLLMCIRNYCHAVPFKDEREIGDKHLKFHFIFEWYAANEGIHVVQ
jgi:hypothetical protein